MTEAQVVETIQKVVQRVAHKYKFAFYDYDDICQEGFLIAMEGLQRYDGDRPLENFLAVHVSNRLKNFKRDNFCRQQSIPSSGVQLERNNAKRFLMEPLDISNVRDEDESNMRVGDNFVLHVEQKEYMQIIDKNLDVSMRSDYLRIIHGVYVPKPRREQILNEINNIIENNKDA